MERGTTHTLFTAPAHAYTLGLMRSVPDPAHARQAPISIPGAPPDPSRPVVRGAPALSGELPSPMAIPPGCPFHPRCPVAQDVCRSEVPRVVVREAHVSACHFPLG